MYENNTIDKCSSQSVLFSLTNLVNNVHSYDILGAGMLWKPKKARNFVKIHAEECFDKVLNEEF